MVEVGIGALELMVDSRSEVGERLYVEYLGVLGRVRCRLHICGVLVVPQSFSWIFYGVIVAVLVIALRGWGGRGEVRG